MGSALVGLSDDQPARYDQPAHRKRGASVRKTLGVLVCVLGMALAAPAWAQRSSAFQTISPRDMTNQLIERGVRACAKPWVFWFASLAWRWPRRHGLSARRPFRRSARAI